MSGHEPSARTTLNAIAADLADLARAADELQAVIGALVRAAAPPARGEAVREVQRLDYIVQRLRLAVAGLEALGADGPEDWRAPARHNADPNAPASGEPEIF